MALGHHKRAVGTFSSYQDAETALYELRDSGFSMDRVSIVGRDAAHRNDMTGVNAGDRIADATRNASHNTEADEGVKTGALAGGAVGGLTGLLVGLGAIAIPGVGPVMLGGAIATALATAVSGGVIGAATGGLVGGLVGLGIPEDRAKMYSDRVSRGEYLVMVEGSEEEIRRAETVLNRRGIQDWGIYDSPTGYDSPRDQPIDPTVPTGYPTDTSRAGSHTPLM